MRVILLLACVLCVCTAASAQESAQFLKIGVGARAVGMGGAYTAMGDDASVIAWNPAGLSHLTKRELAASHAQLTAGTRYDFLGYAQPTGFGTFAAGAIHLTHGTIGGRDAAGRPTGGFGASDSSLSLGFASKLRGGPRWGGSVKYISSAIAERSARTYALDLGTQHELAGLGPGVPRLGLAVQNLGPGMRFLDESAPLPLSVAAGVAYRLPAGWVIAADYKNRPYTRTSEVSVGTEYALFPSFAVRGGYAASRTSNSGATAAAGALNGMAAGFGLRSAAYTLDYSMTPFGELGNAQRFSLGARF